MEEADAFRSAEWKLDVGHRVGIKNARKTNNLYSTLVKCRRVLYTEARRYRNHMYIPKASKLLQSKKIRKVNYERPSRT